MTLTDVEKALLEGRVWALINPAHPGRYWRARRNGQTRTNRQGEWSIPVKAGFHHTSCLTSANVERMVGKLRAWRIDP
jgi:hypothetical protein